MLHTLLCNKNCLPLGLLPYTAHLHLARQYSLGARHHSLVLDAVVSAHGVVLKQHSVPSLPRSTTRSTLARGWLRSASAPGTCSPASSGKLSKKHSNRLSPHRHGVGKGRGIGDNIKASGVRRSPRGGLFLHETERPRPVQPVRGPPKVLVPAARHASPGFLLLQHGFTVGDASALQRTTTSCALALRPARIVPEIRVSARDFGVLA